MMSRGTSWFANSKTFPAVNARRSSGSHNEHDLLLFSSTADNFVSESAETQAALRAVGTAPVPLDADVTYAIDAGFDDITVWDTIWAQGASYRNKEGVETVMRADEIVFEHEAPDGRRKMADVCLTALRAG